MTRLRDRRLPARVVALFVLGLAPLLVIAFVATRSGVAGIESRVDHELTTSAELAAAAVEVRIQALAASLESFAARPDVRSAAAGRVLTRSVEEHMRDFRGINAGVSALAFTDPNGKLIVSIPDSEIEGEDYSHRDYFRGAKSTGDTYVAEAIVSDATKTAVVPIATPVFAPDDSGAVLGYVGAGFSLAALQGLADSLGEGHKMHLRIADRSGHRIAGPESTQQLTSIANDPAIAAAIAGGRGVIDVDRTGHTDRVAFLPIDSLDWAVSVDLDHATAYAAVTQLKRSVFIGLGLLVLLVGAGATTMSALERRRLIAERDRAEAAAELARANAALVQSNEELAQFAYVASHDLAEPLRAIAGFVQLLSDRYSGHLDERADRYIEHVVAGTTRMRTLIDDLLSVSRAVNSPGKREPVALDAVVASALESLAPAVTEFDATVEVGDLPAVLGDPGPLTQVFQNLIGNGIKFHRPGVAPRIQVAAGHHDDGWLVTITDNGIGIDEQYRERVFRMFQRLHGRNEYAGTGIGLALAKRIIERQDGSIWIEDPPEGPGTRFCITLPAAAGDENREVQSDTHLEVLA